MLDISIFNADKATTTDKKLQDFLSKEYTVTEKFDGCLDYNTPIETLEYGILPIGRIVEENIKCHVASFDVNDSTKVYEQILGVSAEENKDNWYEIELENGKQLIVTENHYIWLDDYNCWRQVKELKVGDSLLLDL